MAPTPSACSTHLGVERAHVVGASMGGMIAQTIAIEHPERVLSLVSIMSNTGGRWTASRRFDASTRCCSSRRRGTARLHRAHRDAVRPIGSAEPRARRSSAARDRRPGLRPRRQRPRGAGRQLAAILAVRRPHGAALADDHVPDARHPRHRRPARRPSGGKATAKAIPGAALLLIDGMGHDLPRGAWDAIVDGIVRMARRAGTRSASRRSRRPSALWRPAPTRAARGRRRELRH